MTTALKVPSIFIDNYIKWFGIPRHVLTDTAMLFVDKFFYLLCHFSGTKHLSNMAYRSETN